MPTSSNSVQPGGRHRSTPLHRSLLALTQRPLGGKAQQGGQRPGSGGLGALEAYGRLPFTPAGTAHVQSDDMQGRNDGTQTPCQGQANSRSRHAGVVSGAYDAELQVPGSRYRCLHDEGTEVESHAGRQPQAQHPQIRPTDEYSALPIMTTIELLKPDPLRFTRRPARTRPCQQQLPHRETIRLRQDHARFFPSGSAWGQRTFPNGHSGGRMSPRPETINLPHPSGRDATGCSARKIFGPSKGTGNAIAASKRVRHRGIVCERCGVEVTEAGCAAPHGDSIKLAGSGGPHVWVSQGESPAMWPILLDICRAGCGADRLLQTGYVGA